MATANTGIEWTDATWGPVTGCSKVSPGCAHCYAETIALRFWPTQYPAMPPREPLTPESVRHGRPREFTDVQCHEDRLDTPLRWRKPRRVFVNSMSDLFHEDVSDAFIDRVFAVMALSYAHTFQILTKRADRMRAYLSAPDVGLRWLAAIYSHHAGHRNTDDQAYQERDVERWSREGLPNAWLGVSCENQHFADARIPLLLQTPAAVRFISAEPLLGPVDLEPYLWDEDDRHDALCGLDWVIVGGESGPGARPFDLAWGRSLVQQCQSAGVPVFVKQLGANAHIPDEWNGKFTTDITLRDRKGGDPAEWPEDLRVREFPHAV